MHFSQSFLQAMNILFFHESICFQFLRKFTKWTFCHHIDGTKSRFFFQRRCRHGTVSYCTIQYYKILRVLEFSRHRCKRIFTYSFQRVSKYIDIGVSFKGMKYTYTNTHIEATSCDKLSHSCANRCAVWTVVAKRISVIGSIFRRTVTFYILHIIRLLNKKKVPN